MVNQFLASKEAKDEYLKRLNFARKQFEDYDKETSDDYLERNSSFDLIKYRKLKKDYEDMDKKFKETKERMEKQKIKLKKNLEKRGYDTVTSYFAGEDGYNTRSISKYPKNMSIEDRNKIAKEFNLDTKIR